jgi:DNA polymerase
MSVKRVYGDFESFWAEDYTLTKMVTIDYILDPRWETIGCGIAIDDNEPFWLSRDKAEDFFNSIDEPYMFISHNALFDASILAYRYSIFPTLCIDTLGMSRALLMAQLPNGKASLEKVAEFLDIGTKGKMALKTKGMHRKEIEANRQLYSEFTRYCLNDVELCRKIYNKLKSQFPASEHVIMDMIIRTTTQLQLQLDMRHLNQHLLRVRGEKETLLEKVKCTKDDLMSNPKFAKVLRDILGVDPPTKISPATGELTWAFARSDNEFTALLEHDDPDVQALVAARLGHKSTLEETRTEKFIGIGNVTINSYGATYIPMALRYGAAHTGRFGGDWGLNLQNLPVRKSKRLREAIVAPADHVILAVDAAQIEARLVAWFAKQDNLLQAFEDGRDVYKEYASDTLFHVPLEMVTKTQRFVAKESILGLGFQLGPAKLLRTLIFKAQDQGIPVAEPFTMEQTKEWVDIYRNKYNNIKQYWYYLNSLIPHIANGEIITSIRECCEVKHQQIILPNKLSLFYYDLKMDEDGYEWWFTYGGRRKKLYGGKLLENLVQSLDRIIVMDAALRVYQRTGYRIAHNIHDEIIYVVPESEVEALRDIVLEEMVRRPKWAEDLPLAAEAKVGSSYGALE